MFSLQTLPQWTNTHHNLIQMTEDVDYDVDAYAQQLEELLEEKLQVISKFKERVSVFRAQLAEEELMSKNIHQ